MKGRTSAMSILLVAIGVLSLHAQPQPARPTERLVWQDEFSPGHASDQPDPAVWTYDQGAGGWGNGELETYCVFGSKQAPCDPAKPNAFVGKDGYLHITARRTPDGAYTSARLKSQGLKSFQYGRFEARIKIPAGQGMWPAFWLLGDDIETTRWPACGELDVMENIGKEPSQIHGSIHGKGFPGPAVGAVGTLPGEAPISAAFHTFGMIWEPGKVSYYIDDPGRPYAVNPPKRLPAGGVWPFDGRPFFLLLNLAVGGGWPGNPDDSTQMPSEMLVDYVRVWQTR